MTTMIESDEEIQDFSSDKQGIKFKVDGDVFVAAAELPGLAALEFNEYASKFEKGTNSQKVEAITALFKMILTSESAELFIARLRDANRPIGITKLNTIISWLMEQYGMRPTQPSEDSSDGSASQDTGTNSTENSSSEE